MKKKFPALLAAFLITAMLAAGMIVVGQDAMSSSKAEAAPAISASAAAQIQQILVQYQTRELEYQSLLDSANARLLESQQQTAQSNLQIQQYQSVLSQLQDKGLITIASDGNITVH